MFFFRKRHWLGQVPLALADVEISVCLIPLMPELLFPSSALRSKKGTIDLIKRFILQKQKNRKGLYQNYALKQEGVSREN